MSAPERTNAASSEPVNEAPQQPSTATAGEREDAAPPNRSNGAIHAGDNEVDRVREAMKDALKKPYAADLHNGPSTSSTIRLPADLWERLDMAARLEGQTKQSIIADALKEHLKRIGSRPL